MPLSTYPNFIFCEWTLLCFVLCFSFMLLNHSFHNISHTVLHLHLPLAPLTVPLFSLQNITINNLHKCWSHSSTVFSKALCLDLSSSTYVLYVLCWSCVNMAPASTSTLIIHSYPAQLSARHRNLDISTHLNNLKVFGDSCSIFSHLPLNIWRHSSVSQRRPSGELYLQISALPPLQTHLRDISSTILSQWQTRGPKLPVMTRAPVVSRVNCSVERSAFSSSVREKLQNHKFGFNLLIFNTCLCIYKIIIKTIILFFFRVDIKSGRCAVLCLWLVFYALRTRAAHSSAVLIECSSLNCDNSICSASLAMNYGWTLQPLNYGDWAALGFLRAPAGVIGSAWIYRKLREEKSN